MTDSTIPTRFHAYSLGIHVYKRVGSRDVLDIGWCTPGYNRLSELFRRKHMKNMVIDTCKCTESLKIHMFSYYVWICSNTWQSMKCRTKPNFFQVPTEITKAYYKTVYRKHFTNCPWQNPLKCNGKTVNYNQPLIHFIKYY